MPESPVVIEHVIPHVGPTEVSLYPPADTFYIWLRRHSETNRLKGLRHLGALSHALPGARHARWDYTVALLYYAQSLNALPAMNTSFNLGAVHFSSVQAALQTIALCWNIGHLPGTFSVEKGVYRFLHRRNKDNPANELPWPNEHDQRMQVARKAANRFLREQDYLGVSRVLAVIKLLSLLVDDNDDGGTISDIVYEFTAPFLLSYDDGESKQGPKLRKAFTIVRHLSYLTLDTTLSGLQWCPSIPSLLRQELDYKATDLERLADRVCEILSPIERVTYASLYHREVARRETAVVADWVYEQLERCSNPSARISEWMNGRLFRDLRIGRKPSMKSAILAGAIRLRTHFAGTEHSPVEVEFSLQKKKFPLALVSHYQAWNSEAMLEPDEWIIDAIVRRPATPDDVGRLLVWMIAGFETADAAPADTFELLRKADFENVYISLLKRAFELTFPGKSASIEPWPLSRFGLFPKMPLERSRGAVWACDAKLGDQIAKHITRSSTRQIPADLRDRYAELMGIRELRAYLRRNWNGMELRQRCLLVPASVRFQDQERYLIEFDGGIVVISSRSGRITWYGLESKRGHGDPLHSLERRLETLGIWAPTVKLSARYAFAQLELRKRSERKKRRETG